MPAFLHYDFPSLYFIQCEWYITARAIFKFLRNKTFDVALLQETHCVQTSEAIWTAEWGGRAFFSNGASNARGVMTLLKKDSDVQISDVIMDADGRLLILHLIKDQEKFVVANIYAPTQAPRPKLTS